MRHLRKILWISTVIFLFLQWNSSEIFSNFSKISPCLSAINFKGYDLPDALSPHTRQTADVFVEEVDELESAADDVVVVFDEAGEKG